MLIAKGVAYVGALQIVVFMVLLLLRVIGRWSLSADQKRLHPLIPPPSMASSLFLAPLSAIPGMLVAINGYGAYIRPLGILLVPASAASLLLPAALLSFIHRRVRWKWSNEGQTLSARGWIPAFLLFLTFALSGWIVGSEIRKVHCRHVCRVCDILSSKLEEHRAACGSYPSSLADVPDFEAYAKERAVTVQAGEIGEFGLDVGNVNEADATIYLKPDSYSWMVPIELRNGLFSFTRFYVYARSSGQSKWVRTPVVWFIMGGKSR